MGRRQKTGGRDKAGQEPGPRTDEAGENVARTRGAFRYLVLRRQ